ncbi:MAG: hypothetical protein MPI93_01990 [Nitrosopumilus sp.]|nr:hypothetical protein [Nitrosopumilus sp.]
MDTEEIWEKGQQVPEYEPSLIRKDKFGAWIYKEHHGKKSDFGWTSDDQVPLHWRNAGADGGHSEVTSNAGRNVPVGSEPL